MDEHKVKYIFYLLVIITVLFFLSVGIVLISKKIVKGGISEDDVYLNSSEYVITIGDKLSVSDQFGRQITEDNNQTFGYVEFEVYNNVKKERKYQIYLTELENELEINPNYIKLYLTNENDQPFPAFSKNKVPSFVDLNYIDDKPSSKLLYEDVLKSDGKAKYKLRVWIADNYVVSNSDSSFKFEIGVRAL